MLDSRGGFVGLWDVGHLKPLKDAAEEVGILKTISLSILLFSLTEDQSLYEGGAAKRKD